MRKLLKSNSMMTSEIKAEVHELSEKLSQEDKETVSAAEKSLEALTAKYIGQADKKVSAHQLVANLETLQPDELKKQLATQTANSAFLTEISLDNLRLTLLIRQLMRAEKEEKMPSFPFEGGETPEKSVRKYSMKDQETEAVYIERIRARQVSQEKEI